MRLTHLFFHVAIILSLSNNTLIQSLSPHHFPFKNGHTEGKKKALQAKTSEKVIDRP
jgi:hypothetical protein